MGPSATNPEARLRWLAIALGVFSFTAVLAAFNFTDGDLWAKLALGAHVWLRGGVLPHDVFAFTPVFPEYIDHEWGAGFVFYLCLKWFGPDSLMLLKILLAFGALITAMITARRLGYGWNSLLVLAIPCAACILPAYVPVLRSHTFTFFFFGLTLLGLEDIRAGRKWPVLVLPLVMLAWANVHGGFVAGLGATGVYTAFALFDLIFKSSAPEDRAKALTRFKLLLVVSIASLSVTIINPYGFKFWTYMIPALLNKRAQISEWQPLGLFGNDVFFAFRILFVLVVFILLVSWRHTEKKSWPGLFMVLLTAYISWRSRRHGPFFGVATLAFIGPFAAVAYARFMRWMPGTLSAKIKPAFLTLVVQGLLAIYVAIHFLPLSSFQVLSPVGLYPVREVDILSLAQAKGNLAVPFWMGSYASWRLYPDIKVSMDGRYETTYPESSFRLNEDFYTKFGTNWDRILHDYPVDYVILDLQSGKLQPEDLASRGYALIWLTRGASALMVKTNYAETFRQVAANLPPTTVDPLDAAIPEKWWPKQSQ